MTTLDVMTIQSEAKGFFCWNNLVTTCNVVTWIDEFVKKVIGHWALNVRP